MIDLTAESPIPLDDAARLIPAARNGKRCHLSTILRWILKGSKAPDGTLIKLEGCRIGSRWFTTAQAIQRFSQALTPLLGDPAPAPRSDERRRRSSERAAEELERRGM